MLVSYSDPGAECPPAASQTERRRLGVSHPPGTEQSSHLVSERNNSNRWSVLGSTPYLMMSPFSREQTIVLGWDQFRWKLNASWVFLLGALDLGSSSFGIFVFWDIRFWFLGFKGLSHA